MNEPADHTSPWKASSLPRMPNSRTLLVAILICGGVFLLRLPSLFEPAWHTDEGTFAGVAQSLVSGGSLYSEAWESKPPLFLYLYAGIFKLFGAGILPIRLAATVAAIAVQVLVFLIAFRSYGSRKALWASALLGVLFAVPFWEGNLALSEIFSLPFACAGVLILVAASQRGVVNTQSAVAAGALFGLSFLIRQPTVLAMGAAVVWLLLERRLSTRSLVAMCLACAAPVALVTLGFAAFGSFYWFWDANVVYFFSYVPSWSRLHPALIPLLVLPLAMTLVLLLKDWRENRSMPGWALPALWFSLAYIGALINGKDYSHYLLQTFPPLALLVVNLEKPRLPRFDLAARALRERPAARLGAVFLVSWLVVIGVVYRDPTGRHWTKGPDYYLHMARYALGVESQAELNAYFDKRVNTTVTLTEELERLDAEGAPVYIWGEYPWVYALSDVRPLSRYVTSNYMLENDERFPELMSQLNRDPPAFVLFFSDVQPKPAGPETRERFARMNRAMTSFVERRYEPVTKIGNCTLYRLRHSGQMADQ